MTARLGERCLSPVSIGSRRFYYVWPSPLSFSKSSKALPRVNLSSTNWGIVDPRSAASLESQS